MSGRATRVPLVAGVVLVVVAAVAVRVFGGDGATPQSPSGVTSERLADALLACETGWGIGLFDGAGAPVGRVSDSAGDGEIDWSPDGQALAFQRGPESFVVGVDGRSETNLGVGAEPSWSPDGTQLVVHGAPYSGGSLIVVDADGQHRRVVATDTGRARARWSPDGTRLLYASPAGLMVVSTAGGNPQILQHGIVSEALWSPDGAHIAYSVPNPDVVAPARPTQAAEPYVSVFVVDADGSNAHVLVPSSWPRTVLGGWWPDGSRIAYFRRGELHSVGLTGDDVMMAILPDGMYAASIVSWSPAGSYMTFSVDTALANYVVGADGSNGHLFTTANRVQCWEAGFRPTGGALPLSPVSPTTQPPSPPQTAPSSWQDYVGLEFAGTPPLPADALHRGGKMLLDSSGDEQYGVDYIQQGNTQVLLFSLSLSRPWGPWWRVVDVLTVHVDREWTELSDCVVDGMPEGNIITYYESPTTDWLQTPTRAWRFNAGTQRVESFDPTRVQCHLGDD